MRRHVVPVAVLSLALVAGMAVPASAQSPGELIRKARLDPGLDGRCLRALRSGVTGAFCDRSRRRASAAPAVRVRATGRRPERRRRAARGQAALYGPLLRPGVRVRLSRGRRTRRAQLVLLFAAPGGAEYVRFGRLAARRPRAARVSSRRDRGGRLVVRLHSGGRTLRPVRQRRLSFAESGSKAQVTPAPPPAAPPPVSGAAGRVGVTECPGGLPGPGAPPGAFDALWTRSGPGWTGGDGAYSVPLPDGRVVWIFGDTFIGGVGPDRTRSPGSPMVSNTLVVQDGSCLTTLHGGSPDSPAALVPASEPGTWYWPAAGTVEGSSLLVTLGRYRRTGPGMWDWRFDGNAVAVFSLPDLRLAEVVGLPGPGHVAWGAALLAAGGHTYVYGVDDRGLDKRVHVARAPRGNLRGPWLHFDGAGWTPDPARSAPVLDGVSNAFSVLPSPDGVRLVTQQPLTDRLFLHAAPSPEGPWDAGRQIASVPDPGDGRFTYNALAHPHLSRANELLISYSVNTASGSDPYADADAYRPRFLAVPDPDR